MRCVKEEHTAVNMNLHYLENGTVMLNFIYMKELFFLPLGFVLKVLTDEEYTGRCLPALNGIDPSTDQYVTLVVWWFGWILTFGWCLPGLSGLDGLPDLQGTDQRTGGQLLLQELCFRNAAHSYGGGLCHPQQGAQLPGRALPG